DRIFLRKYTNALGAIDEDAVAIQQTHQVGVGLREIAGEVADLRHEDVVDVVHQAADARVARVEALAGDRLADVVNQLALVEGVEEGGEGAKVEGGRTHAEQVVVDAHQLAQDRANVLAARRQFDPEQQFDRVMPGDLVHQRRDVVHPVDDRDVLVEV